MQRVGIRDAARAGEGLSAPVLRRAAPAADDRHGAGLEPDILIADEPTTALDVTVQAEILRLLGKLRDETGMGLLMITHDLGVVAEMADRVLVMNAGEMVESGETRAVFRNPAHPYTRKLLAARPGRRARSAPTRSPTRRRSSRSGTSSKNYGSFHALEGHQLRLRAGETVAVVGESGSGKSTAARAMLRLDEPDGGAVIYKGRDLFKLTDREVFALRREIQMVFQDPTQSLNPRMTVFQLISEAWRIHPEILPKAAVAAAGRRAPRPRRAQARASRPLPAPVLRRPAAADRHRAGAGHGAEDHRLRRGGLGARRLDPGAGDQAAGRAARPLGIAFIFIAHDLPVVRDFADRVIVMKDGEIVEKGDVRADLRRAARALYPRAPRREPRGRSRRPAREVA